MNQKGFAPLLIVIILAALVGGYFVYQKQTKSVSTPKPTSQPSQAPSSLVEIICPADAKLCPDGSTVGRVGPKCEFAPCPIQ